LIAVETLRPLLPGRLLSSGGDIGTTDLGAQQQCELITLGNGQRRRRVYAAADVLLKASDTKRPTGLGDRGAVVGMVPHHRGQAATGDTHGRGGWHDEEPSSGFTRLPISENPADL